MPTAGRCASQDQGSNPLWVLQGKLLRDHPTHGNPENVGLVDFRRIQHRRRIGGQQRDRVWAGRHSAAAYTPIVESNGAIAFRHLGPCSVPHVGGIAEAHDQQDGESLPLLVPINLRSAILGKWHTEIPIITHTLVTVAMQ